MMRLYATILALLAMLGALPSEAAQRTFVSAGEGNDANPCTRNAPCRSFTAALAVTDVGGELIVLDSGGYGPFTATSSVTIDAPSGVAAALTVFVGNGIEFNGGADARLVIRGVQLTSLGGLYGVILGGGAAHLKGMVIDGFGLAGARAGSGGVLTVDDCTFVRNGDGVQIGGGDLETAATVNRSRFVGQVNIAVSTYRNGRTTIRDSIVAGNHVGVIVSANQAATTATVAVERTVFTGNNLAMSSHTLSGVSTTWVSDSTIVFNVNGVFPGDLTTAPILSRSNNTLLGNDADGGFSTTFAAD